MSSFFKTLFPNQTEMANDENPVVIDSRSRTKAAESAKGSFCGSLCWHLALYIEINQLPITE